MAAMIVLLGLASWREKAKYRFEPYYDEKIDPKPSFLRSITG